MKEFFNEKVIPGVMWFVNTRAISAIKNGMITVMPFTIIGSVFLLLANIPIQAVSDWVNDIGLAPFLMQAFNASFGIMAFFACMGIASAYVKSEGFDGGPPGMIALAIFILMMLPSVTNADGITIDGVINTEWTAGKGMLMAILVGLFVGIIYSFFLKRDIRIKLPDAVPPNVAGAFTALIPAAVLITIATIIYGFMMAFGHTTLFDLVYNVIQTPLQGLTDSFGGMLAIGFLIPFLWFFGIHGATLVGGIMGPLLLANTNENQAIVNAGQALTIANGGHIVTQQFVDQFMTVTGSGMTIGIAIFMVAFARSKEYKTLGKLSVGPAFFNINEPILFATPIVMNPIMAVPFILTPMVSGTLLYLAQRIGLVPLFGTVLVPWTTPPIISGFLVGGWRAAILQAIVCALSFFIYLPFIKKMDNMAYANEMEGEVAVDNCEDPVIQS